ncbi:SPX domain-containing membrane protein OsI_32082-like isoform X2 [Phragmites australis]|uniref:SPX domain-containing membrane protein OsI_32082-like isoform X2 n=1 Tax=Phragmites australis TaxID=29695 RepID=UPI002D79155F|nr:SPX domain-containing membrane protein OsI_32082-like isoform X2 [Phragmites australis]
MVNFSKKLTTDQIPGWGEYYFNYRLLKGRVKEYTEQTREGNRDRRRVLKDFSKLLDDEIEKIVLFMIEQQGLIAARLEDLGKKRARLQDLPLLQEIAELREAYREVGLDLVKLLKFVEINANAVRKILKKFDERLGYKFTDYYVKSRSNHPYSQLQQVFRHVGIGAVVGALSRNLSDLEEREGSYLNIYDQHPLAIPKDPIIDLIKTTADKLTNSTNFLRFLGQHALIAQDDTTSSEVENVEEDKYYFISLVLNLVNTFLYMVNTYIIVPTADDYATSLGAAATVCGVIIGSMAVAQIFSSVYFSAWSNRSYFRPLLFSSVVLLLGNVMYALAYDLDSLAILLIGRLLCGLGSARAVNRRYISDCVPPRLRMQASAAFVSASALGMACGPALAGLLQTNFKLHVFTINQDTLPGWVMAFGWLAYLIWLWISFKEPALDPGVKVFYEGSSTSSRYLEQELEQGLAEQLLVSNGNDQGEVRSLKPASSFASAYRLLTPSVKVQLLIYFMLKYAMEILLSESSVVTSYYFGWTTSTIAVFLAILGLTVLPVNAIVGTYISNMFEDRQILLASEVVLLVGVLLSFRLTGTYTVAQYVCSALLTFVSAEVLEGVNLSLLSQVMSSRLSRGTYNGGLLSTEAGTLARVVADGTITLAGYLGKGAVLNATLLPSLLICLASIAATISTYNSLFY